MFPSLFLVCTVDSGQIAQFRNVSASDRRTRLFVNF